MTPKDADVLCSSVRERPTFLPSMVWRWSGGRALRSKWRAFIVVLVPTKDARLHPPLTAAIPSKLMTAACRVSGVPSGGLLRQFSSIGAVWTLRDAALHRPLPAATASRAVGCIWRACFAASAHCLGAAVVMGGRVGVGVGPRTPLSTSMGDQPLVLGSPITGTARGVV